MNKLSLYAWTSNLSSANHPKKTSLISKTNFQEGKEKYQKKFFKDVWAFKMISTQFWIRFWIHSNKFLEKEFAKSVFLKTFLVCNFWKVWFWFFLTNPSVEPSNMLSSMPMEFKKMQNKILIHMKTLYGLWIII